VDWNWDEDGWMLMTGVLAEDKEPDLSWRKRQKSVEQRYHQHSSVTHSHTQASLVPKAAGNPP
jgi:hypothetical protein